MFRRDEMQDGLVGLQRNAEIALQHPADPGEILHGDRIVEVVFLAQELQHLLVALLAGQRQHGIAGQELLQREDEQCHQHQSRYRQDEAPADEAQHYGLLLLFAVDCRDHKHLPRNFF